MAADDPLTSDEAAHQCTSGKDLEPLTPLARQFSSSHFTSDSATRKCTSGNSLKLLPSRLLAQSSTSASNMVEKADVHLRLLSSKPGKRILKLNTSEIVLNERHSASEALDMKDANNSTGSPLMISMPSTYQGDEFPPGTVFPSYKLRKQTACLRSDDCECISDDTVPNCMSATKVILDSKSVISMPTETNVTTRKNEQNTEKLSRISQKNAKLYSAKTVIPEGPPTRTSATIKSTIHIEKSAKPLTTETTNKCGRDGQYLSCRITGDKLNSGSTNYETSLKTTALAGDIATTTTTTTNIVTRSSTTTSLPLCHTLRPASFIHGRSETTTVTCGAKSSSSNDTPLPLSTSHCSGTVAGGARDQYNTLFRDQQTSTSRDQRNNTTSRDQYSNTVSCIPSTSRTSLAQQHPSSADNLKDNVSRSFIVLNVAETDTPPLHPAAQAGAAQLPRVSGEAALTERPLTASEIVNHYLTEANKKISLPKSMVSLYTYIYNQGP